MLNIFRKKRGTLSSILLISISIMLLAVSFSPVFAADDIGQANFEKKVKTLNGVIFDWVKKVVQLGLFVYILFLTYQAFFGQDKQGKWMQILICIAFIFFIKSFDTIWTTIFTDSAVSTTTSSDSD